MARAVAVMVGGAAGALARWGIGVGLGRFSKSFPWPTFIANVSGAFVLGFLSIVLTERLPRRSYLRPLLAVGFLGAYTTFSTMAIEGIELIDAGRGVTAAVYWTSTLIVGQMAGVYGMWIARLETVWSKRSHEA